MRDVLYRLSSITLFLIALTTCGKDGPTKPQPPEPTPPPPPAPVATRIEVTPSTATLNAIGQTVQLTARVLDQNNSTMAGATVTWTSSAVGVATVSAGGLVTAVMNGAAVITARSGNATATVNVTVSQTARTLAIEPGMATLMSIGQTIQLTARVLDQNNNPMVAATVTWTSSDVGVATVSAEGLVTAVANGAAVITARSGNASATVNVTVSQAARTLAIEPDSATLMSIGQTVQLTATVLDQNEQPVDDAVVTWHSSDESVATVDAQGLVTAVNYGTVRITARSGNASADIEVKVMQSVGSIAITPDEAIIHYIGATVQLEATVLDPDGQPITGAVVTWESSDENVATVDDQGLVTAVANGTSRITARLGNVRHSVTVTVEASSARTERDVLVAFYYSTGGPEWKNNTNWLSAKPIGEWHGVITNVFGEVERLILPNNGLIGTITVQLAQLTSLEILNLGGNKLTGGIPAELGDFDYLLELDLSQNNLTGEIPAELGQIGLLSSFISAPLNRAVFNLGYNQLTGPIPPELGNLVNVQFFSLSRNALTGGIPAELGKLTQITLIDLGDNRLTGSIPPEFGNLSKLEYLRLYGNPSLSGPLPLEMIKLENLRYLYLNGTRLCVPSVFEDWAGSIEDAFISYCETESMDRDVLISFYHASGGENWTTSTNWLSSRPLNQWFGVSTGPDGQVDQLSLENNNLAGTITPVLARLSALRILNLGDNPSLGGQLPLELVDLPLESVRVAGTSLCAPADESIQTWLMQILEGDGVANCNQVIQLERDALIDLYHATNGPNWRYSDSWLSDQPLGTWFGVSTDRAGRVTALNLNTNGMRGMLPAELGRLSRLEKLDLSRGELTGTLPPEIGKLTELTELNLQHNQLTGAIPPEIGQLTNLRILQINWNELSGNIPPEIGQLQNLQIMNLEENQLTGEIPSEIGQLKSLKWVHLGFNQLGGGIPPEFGQLRNLERLLLAHNQLSGTIPSEIGNLGNITDLLLLHNQLTGEIPPEIGNLNTLIDLWLSRNQLSGNIPREIGQLSNLESLLLNENRLSGAIPPEIGDLSALDGLWLQENRLSGAIPPEIGQLDKLIKLFLDNNQLSGDIPPEIGQLDALSLLHLYHNQLSGGIPPEMGEMDKLFELNLSYNENMSGSIPQELTNIASLRFLYVEGTQICAPDNQAIEEWLGNLDLARIERCSPPVGSMAYLTQATQSLASPLPLVAGEDALLRVFVIAGENIEAEMPPVRATFFQDGAEIHKVNIASQGTSIPSVIDEGSLSSSANEIIPGSVVVPGLELVVEIDPEGPMDPLSGIRSRIPETGRMPVSVRNVPGLDLTVVPLLWTKDPDHGVVAKTEGLTKDDDLFRATRYLLPVRDSDFDLTVREPVHTDLEPVLANHVRLINEVEVVRLTDGGNGYYMGVLTGYGGAVAPRTRSFVSHLHEGIIAHELGHTMNLLHAPCDVVGDFRYPYEDGSIGVWGYDILESELVSPDTPDLMSYCLDDYWISDYHFRRAMLYRIREEAIRVASAGSAISRGLLVWGSVSERDGLVIEPSFVVDAPPFLPGEEGPYQLVGVDGDGNTLFTLNFAMGEILDGEEGGSFAYTIPVRSEWSAGLSRITLSGPEGFEELTRDGDRSAALLLNQSSGRLRGILRDWLDPGASRQTAFRVLPEPGMEIVVSRGVPEPTDW